MSPSDLRFLFCTRRAAVVDKAGGGSAAAGSIVTAGRQAVWAGARDLRAKACAPEIDCSPMVAGSRT